MDGLEERLANSDVNIKIHNRIRPATLKSAQGVIELMLFKYRLGRETFSIRDFLSTTEMETVEADGRKKTLYYNAILCQYRETEKVRSNKFKRAGRDSKAFAHTLTYLLSVAAYNGIFEYHEIIRKAFKPKHDVETSRQRKAKKKIIIKRQGLDQWIEDKWPEYERILTQGLFKRNRGKRNNNDSDRNMRFVLYYCSLTTMKVMGFRQRQMRDCLYGGGCQIDCVNGNNQLNLI